MVQLALAADQTEAEEIETILRVAGIACHVEQAVEHHPLEHEEAPQRILVAEDDLEAAQDAIEALTEPDDFLGEE